MRKIIDKEGKLFGKINIFDFLAIFLIFIGLVIGIFKINDFIGYRKKQIELKKQHELFKVKAIKSKEVYFIATRVNSDLLKYFKVGNKLDKNLEVIDVISKSQLLYYYSKDSILNCGVYEVRNNLYNIIFRGKISLYEYRKDSVFFNDMKYIKGASYKIKIGDNTVVIREIPYSNSFYYVDKNYVIRNVSKEFSKLIKPGMVCYNHYLDTICVIENVLNKTQSYSYEKVLNERSKLYSQNVDINVRIRLKLYKVNNMIYLNNLRPFSMNFEAFIKVGEEDFRYMRFSLNNFVDKQKTEAEFKFLQGNIIIHGLSKEEVSAFRENMVFFTEQNDTAGICKKILYTGFDYFYDIRFVQQNRQFEIEFDKNVYCVIARADLVCNLMKNNNVYIGKYIIYSHVNNFAKFLFPIKGVNTIKVCNIGFDNLDNASGNAIEHEFVVDFPNDFIVPADIISTIDGYSTIGKVLHRVGKRKYLIRLKVSYFSDSYYYGNNRVDVYNRYYFLIRNKKRIFLTYGYFIPNKKIKLVLETDNFPDKRDFNRISNYVKIIKSDITSRRIELLMDVFKINGKYYYYSTMYSLPALGMNISIDTKAGRITGKIIRRNDVNN